MQNATSLKRSLFNALFGAENSENKPVNDPMEATLTQKVERATNANFANNDDQGSSSPQNKKKIKPIEETKSLEITSQNVAHVSKIFKYLTITNLTEMTDSEWSNLTEEQISTIDFAKFDKENQPLITRKLLNNVFTFKTNIKYEKSFQNLSFQTLKWLFSYFYPMHWKSLSDKQVLAINFSEIDPECVDKIIFEIMNNIFQIECGMINRVDVFKRLTDQTLCLLSNDFQQEHWNELEEETKQRIKELFSKNVLNYPNLILMSDSEWSKLSEEQILAIDFGNIAKEYLPDIATRFVNNVFKQFGTNWHKGIKNALVFKKLSFNNIKLIAKYFNEYQWVNLSREQILTFNFKEINKEDLDLLVSNFIKHVFYITGAGVIRASLFLKLSDDTLCFLSKSFEKEHWNELGETRSQRIKALSNEN